MAYNVVHCLNAINDIDDINKGQVALQNLMNHIQLPKKFFKEPIKYNNNDDKKIL